MPVIDDWASCPLAVVQRFFAKSPSNDYTSTKEFFRDKLSDADALKNIPTLNDIPLHSLKSNSLVRFRGMVQDMFDPEFYLGAYEVRDLKSGITSMHSGKFRDMAECKPTEELMLDSSNNVTLDRQTLYCIPIPGENQWVKNIYAESVACKGVSTSSTSAQPKRLKRELDEGSDVVPSCGASAHCSPISDPAVNGNENAEGDSKKAKTNTTEGTVAPACPDLNFPLPDEKGPACLIKLYEEEHLKLNDVVEFIGILSNDPGLASFPDDNKEERSGFLDPGSDFMDGVEEQAAHSPPPSLVPRLHAILCRKLQHTNPLLPAQIPVDTASALEGLLGDVVTVRASLLNTFQSLLFGDILAAEYLICHLLSSVYSRHDVVALGKFALNLSGCPRGSSVFPRLLYKVIEEIVPMSHFLPMSLSNMNDLKFIPKKDYTANRLTSGILQLAGRTHLVLDEVALGPGRLDTNGVSNITALGNVITWQKADYDFNFHKQAFHTDIAVLVLSEGKSILKCDCQVPIAPEELPHDDLESHFRAVLDQTWNLDLLKRIRQFLSGAKLLVHTVPDDIQKEIETDFVNARKGNSQNMSVDDLHGLLVLARLLSLSHGQVTLNGDTWRRAKEMDSQRKARLAGNTDNTGS